MNLRLRLALELERLRRKNLQQLHPLQQLFWECTLRCNVHCRHCGSDCRSAVLTPDMPAEDFLRVLDEIRPHLDPHQMMVVISGGEPTMRLDLEQIGAEISRREFPWGMVTNGLALTPERFLALRKAGMLSLTISLDGLEKDHNWMRQNPYAFEGATRAIRLAAADKKLVWDVVTCVNQHNLPHLAEIRDYLLSFGCHRWRIFGIDPMGRAKDMPDLMLSNQQFREVLDFIKNEREKGIMQVSYSCEGFLGNYEGKVRDQLYQCGAGLTVASVLIDGNISACTSIRGKYYQGNIYKDSFWDVWEHRFESYRNRSWMREKTPCADCKMWRYCEGNGMHLREENGDLMLCHWHKVTEQ